MKFRPNTIDRNIYYSIVVDDEYQLKNIINKEIITIFDVGAHIGSFTVFANLLWPNATIYAFEPDNENYDLLVYNTKDIQNNIILYNKAIVTKNGNYYIKKDQTGNYISILSKEPTNYKIQTYNLQSEQLPKIDLLKLDCEGGEYDILDYLIDNGKIHYIPYICVELHPFNNFKTKTINYLEYIKKLKQYYNINIKFDNNITLVFLGIKY